MEAGSLSVAAVQIETHPGRLAENLEHVERLAEEAFAGGARLVALPEFFPGPAVPSARAWDCVLPAENPALEMLQQLARRHRGWIGGSMLVARGDHVYNTYHFVEPDGRVHTHDKDLPTMWENALYTCGNDPGVFETGLGGVGAAVCWELIRERTVRRLAGHVGLAVTGTHWWDLPANWPLARRGLGALGQYNRYLSEQAPVEFARCLGVPVLQASHSGRVRGDFYLLPGLDWRVEYETRFVGATQVVDASGHVLACRHGAEGAGIVRAEIKPGAVEPVVKLPGRFWIPSLTGVHRALWQHQNAVCRSVYRRFGRGRGLATARARARTWADSR